MTPKLVLSGTPEGLKSSMALKVTIICPQREPAKIDDVPSSDVRIRRAVISYVCSDEATSFGIHAFQVIATALYAGVSLTLAAPPTTGSDSKPLVLTFDDNLHITTSNAMMRLIAAMAPASDLLGDSDEANAFIDGWLNFVWNSIDVPLQVLSQDASVASVKDDVAASLQTLEEHLAKHENQPYLVGRKVSVGDISLAVTLSRATSLGVFNVETTDAKTLAHWFSTITTMPFFIKAQQTSTTAGTVI